LAPYSFANPFQVHHKVHCWFFLWNFHLKSNSSRLFLRVVMLRGHLIDGVKMFNPQPNDLSYCDKVPKPSAIRALLLKLPTSFLRLRAEFFYYSFRFEVSRKRMGSKFYHPISIIGGLSSYWRRPGRFMMRMWQNQQSTFQIEDLGPIKFSWQSFRTISWNGNKIWKGTHFSKLQAETRLLVIGLINPISRLWSNWSV